MHMDTDNQRTQLLQLIHRAFRCQPVCESLLDHLSARSLVRFSAVCHLSRDLVFAYYRYRFSINQHLARFFEDPVAFRSLQARTGTLISGSNALQFFDRTHYPESDLDIYTYPGYAAEVGMELLKYGYEFVPSWYQTGGTGFEEVEKLDHPPPSESTGPGNSLQALGDAATDADVFHLQLYDVKGMRAVYCFTKGVGKQQPPLRLQLIATSTSPLECILGFHSSKSSEIFYFPSDS